MTMTSEQLAALREELRTQDNAITADPLFVVFQQQRVYGVGDDYTDDFEWVEVDDHSCVADEDEAKRLDALHKDGRPTILDGFEYLRIGYKTVPRFVTACFTRKGAEAYVARNGHNLTKPYIYVESLYRNAEMIALRYHLMGDTP